MSERIEQARVGEYREKIRHQVVELISRAGRPPWPSHYVSTVVNGSQVMEPDDPIDPEDVFAVSIMSYREGVAYERKQTWKWLVFVAIVSFAVGGIII